MLIWLNKIKYMQIVNNKLFHDFSDSWGESYLFNFVWLTNINHITFISLF